MSNSFQYLTITLKLRGLKEELVYHCLYLWVLTGARQSRTASLLCLEVGKTHSWCCQFRCLPSWLLHKVPRGRESQQKAQCASSFQAFPGITFANMLFMKTSQAEFQGTLRQNGRRGTVILQKEVQTGMGGIGGYFAANHDLPSTLTTRTVLFTSSFPNQGRRK